jgi:hypothetical protein
MIKQDLQNIANFLLSDQCQFTGGQFRSLTKMLETLRDAAEMVPIAEMEEEGATSPVKTNK